MPNLSRLEDHLGYWLRLVSNQVSSSFAKQLEQHNVSVAEWVAMRHLYEHCQISSTQLATFLGMTRGAVSKILDKLEDKGLAERQPDPIDKRSQLVSLSSKGVDLLPQLAELANLNDQMFFSVINEEDSSHLKGILEEIALIHGWKNPPTL